MTSLYNNDSQNKISVYSKSHGITILYLGNDCPFSSLWIKLPSVNARLGPKFVAVRVHIHAAFIITNLSVGSGFWD